MNYYLAVLKKYAVFSGRATRAEYWYFVLINLIASLILSILDSAVSKVTGIMDVGVLGGIYALALFIPSLAVAIRRLHDTNHSGW